MRQPEYVDWGAVATHDRICRGFGVGDLKIPQERVAPAERQHGELTFAGNTGRDKPVDDFRGGSVASDGEEPTATTLGRLPSELRGVSGRFGKRDLQRDPATLQLFESFGGELRAPSAPCRPIDDRVVRDRHLGAHHSRSK